LAGEPSRSANAAGPAAAATTPTIVVKGAGYSPNQVTVPAGRPVTLTLKTSGTLGCTSIFRIPKLNVEENLTKGPVTKVTVNFPKTGRYTFTCGMGMYSGTINAV
jgi:plastocyanin domain-containing protein